MSSVIPSSSECKIVCLLELVVKIMDMTQRPVCDCYVYICFICYWSIKTVSLF